MKKKRKPDSKSQTFYINGLVLDEIIRDAEEDDRTKSYIVNKILIKYYKDKGKIKED